MLKSEDDYDSYFEDTMKAGAHSTPRILFHQDITGKEITSKLLAAVKKLSDVTMREMWEMTDIIEEDGGCTGIVAKDLSSGKEENIFAQDVIWATGGIGQTYLAKDYARV